MFSPQAEEDGARNELRAVEKIANAVLYEGLYALPYRPSAVKNQQRFNFGVLYPREYCDLQGSEAWEMQTECLVLGKRSKLTIEVKVRFLQMVEREWLAGRHGARLFRRSPADSRILDRRPFRQAILFDSQASHGETAKLGASNASSAMTAAFRVTLVMRNFAALEDETRRDREDILLRSLVSVHSILHVATAESLSRLLDPPEEFRAAASRSAATGAWPVLAGEEGQRDMMLASPIILYDYPQIAPESPGDLFDGTEIDEILALRILTMTDAEKLEVRNGDERARRILERTEMLPPEHFQKLHGALRGLRRDQPEASR